MAGIGDWIAQDNPQRALTFVDEIEQACFTLLDAPKGYPVLTRVNGREIRKKVFSPYLILYEARIRSVHIVAVIHGARDVGALKL